MGIKPKYRKARIIAQWIAKKYPSRLVLTHVGLGPYRPHNAPQTLSDGDVRMTGVNRHWVQAIVVLKSRVLVVDAITRPDLSCISRLLLAKDRFRTTPELQAWRRLPVYLVLLYDQESPDLLDLARQHGIRTVFYHSPDD